MVYDCLFDKEPIHRKGVIVLNSELEAGKNAYGSNAKADVLIEESVLLATFPLLNHTLGLGWVTELAKRFTW